MFSNFSQYLSSYFNDGEIKDANSDSSALTIKRQKDCSKLGFVEDSSDDDLVMVTKPNEYWGDDESNSEDIFDEKCETIPKSSEVEIVDSVGKNCMEGFECIDNPNHLRCTKGSIKNSSPIKINLLSSTNITSPQKRKHSLIQDVSSENSDFENYRGPYINLHNEIWGDQEILTDASDQPEVLSSPSLEESWLVTPAPCFEKLEPVNVVKGCMEDLLLKGPTVSIYRKFICEKERRLSDDKDLTVRPIKESIDSIIKQDAFNGENLSDNIDINDSCVKASTELMQNAKMDQEIENKFKKQFIDVFNKEYYEMYGDKTQDPNTTPTIIMDFFDKSFSFFKKFYLSLNEKNLESEFCSALSNIYHFLSNKNICMNKYVHEMIELRRIFVHKDESILSYIYNMNCKNFSLLIKAVFQGADEVLMCSLEDILKFSLSLNSLLSLVLIGPALNVENTFVNGSKFRRHRSDEALTISNTLNRNNMLQAFLRGRVSNEELVALFRKAKPSKKHSKRDVATMFGLAERQYERKRYQHYHHPYHSRHQQRAC